MPEELPAVTEPPAWKTGLSADSCSSVVALGCSSTANGSRARGGSTATICSAKRPSAIAFAAHASAQVTFYEGEGFRGRTFEANSRIWNFDRFGFNDRASSAIVERGRWEVCEDAGFACILAKPIVLAELREILGRYVAA